MKEESGHKHDQIKSMQNSTPTAETVRGLTFGTHSRFSRFQRAWQHQFLSSGQLHSIPDIVLSGPAMSLQ